MISSTVVSRYSLIMLISQFTVYENLWLMEMD